MKKKNNLRFLSAIFCFMFLLFTGCSGGPGGAVDSEISSLGGVKALTRPFDYVFSEEEKYSENYYNIFAKNALYALYVIYEDMSYKPFIKDKLFTNLNIEENVITYPVETEDKYYLYDSIRFTIKSVTTNTDAAGEKTQTIVWDENSGWNWKIANNAIDVAGTNKSLGNVFYNYSNNTQTNIGNEQGSNYNKIELKLDGNVEWFYLYKVDIEEGAFIPDFSEYYVYKDDEGNDGEVKDGEITDYFISPYYQKYVQNVEVTAKNFYQDALEYATYLFVLGYDYQTENNGQIVATEEASYFDFVPEFDAHGLVIDVKVGWKGNNVSVVEALKEVKQLYKEIGNFVGVTEENISQITRFILDKVVGYTDEKDKFTVSIINTKNDSSGNPISDSDNSDTILTFNRNYKKIVENVVNYACEQSPIGVDEEGNIVTLGNSYVASKITDYSGDYFFANYENNDDSELFKYIKADEYQSLIISPLQENLNKPLTTIILMLEYFENPNGKQNLEELTINVGFRYFSCGANGGKGEIVFSGEYQKKVKYGKNGYEKGDNPDVNYVYIGFSPNGYFDYDITLPEDIKFETTFNNNIGSGILNPFVDSNKIVDESGLTASKYIKGTDDARNYYQLKKSSSYGSYGVLNESMFSVEKAGENACDFLEIYFDVVKEKGNTGINYCFKPALFAVTFEDVG